MADGGSQSDGLFVRRVRDVTPLSLANHRRVLVRPGTDCSLRLRDCDAALNGVTDLGCRDSRLDVWGATECCDRAECGRWFAVQSPVYLAVEMACGADECRREHNRPPFVESIELAQEPVMTRARNGWT